MHVGRYAPSPTGDLHLGNARTALLAWLWARHDGGRILLRIEDLDRARVRPGSEEAQRRDLAALGLNWDGAVVHQSERGALYARRPRPARGGGAPVPLLLLARRHPGGRLCARMAPRGRRIPAPAASSILPRRAARLRGRAGGAALPGAGGGGHGR